MLSQGRGTASRVAAVVRTVRWGKAMDPEVMGQSRESRNRATQTGPTSFGQKCKTIQWRKTSLSNSDAGAIGRTAARKREK